MTIQTPFASQSIDIRWGFWVSDTFVREGELTDIGSYPEWARDLVADCAEARDKVVGHEFFRQMRDNRLSRQQAYTFLVGGFPVIEQFPQYMAQNLLKVKYGQGRGHDMARRYLIRNIRVEQNHADHWVEWAAACGISQDELIWGRVPMEMHALSHWCWHTTERDSLAAAMAATNYAIEGVTGEWSTLVCSADTYAESFAPDVRAKAMKWLRLHARYDDEHPWEALDIICSVLGRRPDARSVAQVRANVLKSYDYFRLSLDHCLALPVRTEPDLQVA